MDIENRRDRASSHVIAVIGKPALPQGSRRTQRKMKKDGGSSRSRKKPEERMQHPE
jgi:hypothetical protein